MEVKDGTATKQLRIVFMGSASFAVASLDALVKAGYPIVGVITAPDKAAGRGKLLRKTAVKEYAESAGLKLLQPANLKDPAFLEEYKALNGNLGVVVAFRMLPEAVWAFPKFGVFNLHASLLPQYRGAAPINHAIINGETETGVTTFFLKHEIDTGNIIFRAAVPIAQDDTFGLLHDKLMAIGAELVLKTVKAIENDSYTLTSQHVLIKPGTPLKTAPKIFKEDCRINWNSKAIDIHNLVRGLGPVPAAFGFLVSPDEQEFQVKIFKTNIDYKTHHEETGSILSDQKSHLGVFVVDGIVNIEELQMAGKKRVFIKDFLNGFRISAGWKFR
jgi:methionyl-tRNA formyltransferase